MRKYVFVTGLFLLAISFNASASKISVTIDGTTYNCGKNAGNSIKYFCECDSYTSHRHSLRYKSIDRKTGSVSDIKNISRGPGRFGSYNSAADCEAALLRHQLCK